VAFGHGHLYVLGTTSVESHKLDGKNVEAASDGSTALVKADIGAFGKVIGVLDGGTQTHLTQFAVDDDGNLQQIAVSVVNRGANGVVVVER